MAKYDCSIEINDDNLDFEFDNEQLKKFFDKYYSAEIINKFLTLKTKFNFESSYTDGLKLSSFNNFDIAQVLIPKEIRDELKKRISYWSLGVIIQIVEFSVLMEQKD